MTSARRSPPARAGEGRDDDDGASISAQSIAQSLACGKSGCACAATARTGKGRTHCPAHSDDNPSLGIIDSKDGKVLLRCFAGCSQEAVIAALRERGLWQEAQRRRRRRIIATYDYTDEENTLVYQTVRYEPKDFTQRRPDGRGGWIWNLGDVRRVPYRLSRLLTAEPEQWVYVVEGEQDADNLALLGLTATTNSGGSGNWPAEISSYFKDHKVAILPDNDDAGHHHVQDVAAKVAPYAAEVKIVNLPGLPDKGDVSDWLAQGHTADELVALVEAAAIYMPPSDIAGTPPHSASGPDTTGSVDPDTAKSDPATLDDVEETFSRWLLMPDMGGLHFALAVLAGHCIGGDPLWGLLVAPPSGAKTEIIRALEAVPNVYPLSELTARTFASGLESGKRETSLLPRLSDHILTLKDFTTILTMHREERQAILAQLREIYDGRFDKVWGTGKELHWRGRLGFIAGVTPIIDLHHAVHQVLGERFILYRMEQPNRRHMAVRALRGRGREVEMRRDLRDVVARFMACLDYDNPPILPSSFEERLAALADLISRARSGVVRDRYGRELTLAPEPEAPARLAKQLAGLAVGHALLRRSHGVEDSDYAFIFRVALDCLPSVRLQVIETLKGTAEFLTTSQVAAHIGYPTTTARRSLEDLAALGIVAIRKAERSGQADNWQLTDEARMLLGIAAVTLSPESELDTKTATVPATSEGIVLPALPDINESDGNDDDPGQGLDDGYIIPPEFTGERHYLLTLGLELCWPRIVWGKGPPPSGGGIPGGRFSYEQAARYFSDADVKKAVVALETLGQQRSKA